MKILFVHNAYQQAGGEDVVVAAEVELLTYYQHDVQVWMVDNKNLPNSLLSKINTALNTRFSQTSYQQAREIIKNFKPDIVHVHNFFPQISPSIYDACLAEGVPVVQSLHNYRLICCGATFLRNGTVCQLCLTGSPYHAAYYGCYRGSKLGSLAVAHMVAWHRKHGTWQTKVNRFIALTDFAKQKFIQAGFPAEKIVVKPNFIIDPLPNNYLPEYPKQGFALFVGRLSAEKGIKTLLTAWQNIGEQYLLKIAGDGELSDLTLQHSHVQALGRLSPTEISLCMQQASFLIVPSEWFEGLPMVIVEAFGHGLPVLASRLGSMAEIIQDGENGLLFSVGDADDLATKIRYLVDHPEHLQKMAKKAKETYLNIYSPSINYQQLIAIYEAVINENKK